MRDLTNEQIISRVHEIEAFAACEVFITDDEIMIYPPGGDFKLNYNTLAWLTQSLGTTAINVLYDEGWAGSEVTPGDPASLRIVVTRWPRAQS